ncbi:hypothetical protein ABZV58_29485 [Nocardia sp. NPDC004654]|uniref:hypothetical protein n=1 Tax=Nocardia sp. NPDC004654 TaxID=3154776 RepID=UPI0033A322EF
MGTYPYHAGANAQVFDYHCHLRHDILAPRGPIKRTLSAPDHQVVHEAIEWMMWGLPQIQGDTLTPLVNQPITLRFTGAGCSE